MARFPPLHDSGFTLLELIAALAIAAILAAIAIPKWSVLLPTYRLNSSARQVQSELHQIKMQAASENVDFQIVFSGGASDYTIQRDSSPWMTRSLPEGIIVAKAGTIYLSPRGTAKGNTVRLLNEIGECAQVVVSPTGRVRICKLKGCNENC